MENGLEKDKKVEGAGDLTAEKLLERLRQALQRGGDFPASAKVVNELQRLTSNPKTSASQITEIILREPSLGTRVLHLVNSSFYQRSKPIMTVSQAVLQIGMRPLAELCSGLVLLQKFVPQARQGGAFADCLQKTILTSLMTSAILSEGDSNPASSKDEQGYLVGTFAELGTLLLAYYFPKIYQSAAKRAATKKIPLAQSITEITGITTSRLSIEVIESLHLPDFYREVILSAENLQTSAEVPAAAGIELSDAGKALFAAKEVSEVMVSGNNKALLEEKMKVIQQKTGMEMSKLNRTMGKLPQIFKDHCASIDLHLPALPEYISHYSEKGDGKTASTPSESESQFMDFVDEIREAVEQREPTASVITSVMETLAWSIGFDRVILLLTDQNRKTLVGRMALGTGGEFNPKEFMRPIDERADKYAPDVTAFREARPVFNGDPLLEEGWPIAVLPIGFGQRSIGVIYADKVQDDLQELDNQSRAAIGVLAELLDRSIGLNA